MLLSSVSLRKQNINVVIIILHSSYNYEATVGMLFFLPFRKLRLFTGIRLQQQLLVVSCREPSLRLIAPQRCMFRSMG